MATPDAKQRLMQKEIKVRIPNIEPHNMLEFFNGLFERNFDVSVCDKLILEDILYYTPEVVRAYFGKFEPLINNRSFIISSIKCGSLKSLEIICSMCSEEQKTHALTILSRSFTKEDTTWSFIASNGSELFWRTEFVWAVESSRVDVIQGFLEKNLVNVNTCYPELNNNTPLMYSILYASEELFEYLIKIPGIDLRVVGNSHRTVLDMIIIGMKSRNQITFTFEHSALLKILNLQPNLPSKQNLFDIICLANTDDLLSFMKKRKELGLNYNDYVFPSFPLLARTSDSYLQHDEIPLKLCKLLASPYFEATIFGETNIYFREKQLDRGLFVYTLSVLEGDGYLRFKSLPYNTNGNTVRFLKIMRRLDLDTKNVLARMLSYKKSNCIYYKSVEFEGEAKRIFELYHQ